MTTLASKIKSVDEVKALSNEEMYYVDKYMSKDNQFINDDVATEFANQWVIRGMP
jgi:hypothetical protein